MAGDNLKHAMSAVMEDMGRAAREGRARRFTGPRKKKGDVEVTLGEITLDPSKGGEGKADVEVDPVYEPGELEELQNSLEVQR